MLGLDIDIIVHRVPLVEGHTDTLVKQKLRIIHLDILIKIKAKIRKQWNVNFFEVVKYKQ
jgi:hypothetical protein